MNKANCIKELTLSMESCKLIELGLRPLEISILLMKTDQQPIRTLTLCNKPSMIFANISSMWAKGVLWWP